jgi:hypothetical protein
MEVHGMDSIGEGITRPQSSDADRIVLDKTR